MKIVLFGMGLIFATSAQAAKLTFTWDKKEIEALKGKAIYSVYCTPKAGGFTQEVCDRVSKNASFKKFKFKTLEWVDSTTIRVGDGPRTVEIKRGTRPGSFVMNGKTFDYGSMTSAQVREKIASAMPRVGRTSLFMNAAYATEFPEVVLDLQDAVNLLSSEKSDEENCEVWQTVALICEEEDTKNPNTESIMAKVKKYTLEQTHAGRARAGKEASEAVENFRKLIDQAGDIVSNGSKEVKNCSIAVDKHLNDPETVSRFCNSSLLEFKIKFDKDLYKLILNGSVEQDLAERERYENLKLKVGEVVKQLETFFPKQDKYDKQYIESVIESGKPVK